MRLIGLILITLGTFGIILYLGVLPVLFAVWFPYSMGVSPIHLIVSSVLTAGGFYLFCHAKKRGDGKQQKNSKEET